MEKARKRRLESAKGLGRRSSKRCVVFFEPNGAKAEVAVGTPLLEAAHQAGVYLNSICGGAGHCGKCKVTVTDGLFKRRPTSLLTDIEVSDNVVLACQTGVLSDMTVVVPQQAAAGKGHILGDLNAPKAGACAGDILQGRFSYEPLVRRTYLEMVPPSVQDHTADYERLCSAVRDKIGLPVVRADLDVLQSLSGVLRCSGYKVTVTVAYWGEGGEIIEVEAGDASKRGFAVAVDVGTTTVVAHLVDLADGTTVDSEATYNSQMGFGEDYIGRIIYAEEHDAFGELQRRIVGDVNGLIAELASRRQIGAEDISAVVCAGNTAMLHFLLGLDARGIRREPYVASAAFVPPVRAADIGIGISRAGRLYCLPSVAAYVGGDIVAGVLATQIYAKKGLSLFVDIGTNGEVVLGSSNWMVCASSSAGPAFEGSGVKHGMRAGPGAIEKATVDRNGEITYRTIGDVRPVGICGSGLLDVLAEFFRHGIIDRMGRFNIGTDRRLREGEDGWQHQLVPAADGGQEIVITQADIDNLIRSKAGVFAAIRVLMESTQTKPEDLDAVYLAGGFGNFLDVRAAVTIGMLPDVPVEKIHFVGNTSIAGAKMALMSRRAFEAANRIAGSMTYFDLMSHQRYMDEFVKASFLPHTDLSLFASVRDAVGG